MRHVAFGAALAAFTLGSAGQAGAVTYDSLAAFNGVAFSQGLGQCMLNDPSCIAVDGARTGLDKAFDAGGITTFHSLGAFGFATFDVGAGMAIRSATTLETTFGNDGGEDWPEALTIILHNGLDAAGVAGWNGELQVHLGPPEGPLTLAALADFAGSSFTSASDITGSQLFASLSGTVLNGTGAFAGYVTNDGNTPDANDIIAAAGVGLTLSDAGDNGWELQIDVSEGFGDYRYITFLDQTMSDIPTFWQNRRGDGWDLAQLSVTAEAVPEPATAALLGLGVLAAGGLRRRR